MGLLSAIWNIIVLLWRFLLVAAIVISIGMFIFNRCGYNRLENEDYDSALKVYNTGLMEHDEAYYVNKGLANHELGNFEQALEDYNKSLEIHPTIEAYNNLGILYSDFGDFEKALEYYLKGLQMDKKDPEINHNLGNLYIKTEKFQKAIEHYMIIIDAYESQNSSGDLPFSIPNVTNNEKKNPDLDDEIVANAYTGCAVSYEILENISEAKRLLDKIISIYPNQSLPYWQRGSLYLDQYELRSATNDFEKYLELRPEDPDVYYMLGLLYKHEDNSLKAQEMLAKLKQLDTNLANRLIQEW